MTAVGWLPVPVEELFGTEATAEESYELLTVDVPPTTWLAALRTARDDLGCTYFDWLSAVDEPGTGFRVSAHVVALAPVRRLLVRTTVPHETPALPTAVDVYAGAAWHERETHEMFGVDFEGHPALDHLLLPETFEGHPLRKDFVLAARVAKAWPGAKEPGESDHGGPKRRQMLPPGVPDPNEWGPLKGQLPAAPARPARGAARAAGERPVRGAGERPVRAAGERPVRGVGESPVRGAGESPAGEAGESLARGAGDSSVRAGGDRPVRRARSASEGSVSQGAPGGGAVPSGEGAVPPAGPRRARSASEGSASQQGSAAAAPRRSRSASDGSASQQTPAPAQSPAVEPASTPAAEPEPTPAAEPSQGPASTREGSTAQPPTASRSADAPWHSARPAFDQPEAKHEPKPKPEPEPSPAKEPADGPSPEADSPASEPDAEATAPAPEATAPAPEATAPEPEATAPAPDAVERTDLPPTPEGPAPEDPTPDTPAGGPQ
ncbi:NADH-quinone oxidoreductase subunit C [Streptomyces prunicolor]|uniref:NADH-quinone oxidoreductase subunit C n=1 Tax=Streptomyces prunicolor TaxID=67348 RepID=UPI00386BBF8B|nr:NADH-quinone oxidoreductase subunit C [Streptomyces prunicolor]